MKKKPILTAIILILAILSGACALPAMALPGGAAPAPSQDAALLTAQAQMTQSIIETVRANMDFTQAPDGNSGQPFATATLAPSSTPFTPSPSPTPPPPTSTPLPPTATVSPTPTTPPCNLARFIADGSIPDGAIMEASKPFTKIWGLKNVGSCIWTTNFSVVYESGDQLTENTMDVKLPKVVLPGGTVNIAVPMKSPDQPGSYIGNYKLKSDDGAVFGIGEGGLKAFWVRINVVKKGIAPGLVAVFTKEYCKGTWSSGKTNPLNCPSQTQGDGSVFLLNHPTLEGGVVEDEPAIIMFPDSGPSGFVQGIMPPFQPREGNRFKAIIGCLANSDDCTVTFELAYTVDGTTVEKLGSWVQRQDGKFSNVDVDLSPLAGQQVKLILRVLSNEDATEDRAFWLVPRVTR